MPHVRYDVDPVDERLKHAAARFFSHRAVLERADLDEEAIAFNSHRELETLVKGGCAKDVRRQGQLVDAVDREIEARPEPADDECHDGGAPSAGRNGKEDGFSHEMLWSRRSTVDDGSSGTRADLLPSTLPTMTGQNDLTVTTEIRAESTILHVVGELDLSTVGMFDAELDRALGVGRVVVVLSECTFIDSSALQSLVRAHRVVRESTDRTIVLVAPSQPARRVLEIAALDRLVPVFDTLDDALAATA